MCTPHQIKALLASELRCIEVERSGKTEAAALRWPDPYACSDPRVAQVELPTRRDPKQSALETGGVADGEQLLGIRPRPARAAHLTGNVERDIDTAVARLRMPLTATDGGRLGGVEDLESVVHIGPFDQAARLGRGFLLERECSRARLATKYRSTFSDCGLYDSARTASTNRRAADGSGIGDAARLIRNTLAPAEPDVVVGTAQPH
jgi:hypothetical protein